MGLVVTTLRLIAAESLYWVADRVKRVGNRIEGEEDPNQERETLGQEVEGTPELLDELARSMLAGEDPAPEPVTERPLPLDGSIEVRLGGRLPAEFFGGSGSALDASILRRRF